MIGHPEFDYEAYQIGNENVTAQHLEITVGRTREGALIVVKLGGGVSYTDAQLLIIENKLKSMFCDLQSASSQLDGSSDS